LRVDLYLKNEAHTRANITGKRVIKMFTDVNELVDYFQVVFQQFTNRASNKIDKWSCFLFLIGDKKQNIIVANVNIFNNISSICGCSSGVYSTCALQGVKDIHMLSSLCNGQDLPLLFFLRCCFRRLRLYFIANRIIFFIFS